MVNFSRLTDLRKEGGVKTLGTLSDTSLTGYQFILASFSVFFIFQNRNCLYKFNSLAFGPDKYLKVAKKQKASLPFFKKYSCIDF